MARLVEAGMLSYWLVRRRQQAAKPHLEGRVLDFGCGVGTLAEICDPAGYVGVDIDPRKIEIARRERPDHRFSTTVPEGERFDTVAALAFIEHVHDPAAYVRRFAGFLEPGGKIVLTTPHPSLEWIHTAGARIGLFSHAAHDEHEDLINKARMQEMLADTPIGMAVYRRFLFGANQLFVLTSAARADAISALIKHTGLPLAGLLCPDVALAASRVVRTGVRR
jgi:2-polyprenyl-3-methyl-5-hydroxy-6-metoxy-1,4-benzoquinol methylase